MEGYSGPEPPPLPDFDWNTDEDEPHWWATPLIAATLLAGLAVVAALLFRVGC